MADFSFACPPASGRFSSVSRTPVSFHFGLILDPRSSAHCRSVSLGCFDLKLFIIRLPASARLVFVFVRKAENAGHRFLLVCVFIDPAADTVRLKALPHHTSTYRC